MLHGPPRTQRLAARLRRDMSLPERILWRALRERPGGLKWRKQHPAGLFALDFFCPARLLAVEVDGAAHGMGDRPARDDARDAWCAAKEVRVLRVPATAVLNDLDAVVRGILAVADEPRPRSRTKPPRR